jgi:hypothetical protein
MASLWFEFTAISKSNGPLTKRIKLSEDGKICHDSSACIMVSGWARRWRSDGVVDFAELINRLDPNEAIALGSLKAELPDEVEIVTKKRLDEINGAAAPKLVARTSSHIQYRAGHPALALIDIDRKGIPPAAEQEVKRLGGFREALLKVLPELRTAASVIRPSTSSGLRRSDTGERLSGSGGAHWFVLVKDGADIERFLKTFHQRCWLHGFGWLEVSASGQLLERSLVDRTVYAPERLVFEASPLVEPPLEQDRDSRRPLATEGVAIDTATLCPDLNMAERAEYSEMKRAAAYRLGRQVAAARESFTSRQAPCIAARHNVPAYVARRIVLQQCHGVLLPAVELQFDAGEFERCTVGDVLADPDRFVGASLSDPLEGPDYGRCKARIMRRPDGTIWIHSFAHGRTTYELEYDAAYIETALQRADPKDVPDLFVRMLMASSLEADEEQALRDLVLSRCSVKAKPLAAKLKSARARAAAEKAKEQRARRSAERTDKRLRMTVPDSDAERTPVLTALDHVLGNVRDPEPPMRDVEGKPVEVRSRQPFMMHELTSAGANDQEPTDTRLPPPDIPLLTRHDEFSLAHLIERHIEYVDDAENGSGRSVAIPPVFIKHYLAYRDSTLPTVTSIVTSPLVLADGALLAEEGLDRERRIVFRIEPDLMSVLPRKEDCTEARVADRMDFLVNNWLCDVAADFESKCVLIALALSILQRTLLPERPAFFVTAGQRGGGKTTAVVMLILAVTGKKPTAAAWSASEEERRKALFAYLAKGIAALVWDNIPRGTMISCPSIEKALTTETCSDRVLGVTETKIVPATTIQVFTGNNSGPRGDMASRSLVASLSVDRPDPENRPFKHPDPVAWTLAHRGEILNALYVILMGNPQLNSAMAATRKTRFKAWWHHVGSAVENAATSMVKMEAKEAEREAEEGAFPGSRPPPASLIDFGERFKKFEAEEEQTTGIAGILDVLYETYAERTFLAAEIASLINMPMSDAEREKASILKGYIEQATGKSLPIVSQHTVGWKLKALVGAPTCVGDKIMILVGTVPKADDEKRRHRPREFHVEVRQA